ncbi:MAG TPA: acyloxyacyl hydrolase [Candidatus Acidoferrales bacterium]|nr:acyloxyacyl hydrolase [Candidatus Acidoferrales bacterium]
MKTAARLLSAIVILCAPLLAQQPTDNPVDVIRHPVWEKGVFLGGSTSFANTPSAQTLIAGVRLGRVLTNEHGSNFLRGTFEMAVDVIPVYEFWIDGNGQYAAAIDPFIVKWNFTSCRKMAPYIAAVGGVVFSTSDLPPHDTSTVNFTSGLELGDQIFRRDRRSLNLAVKIYHLSNASLGNRNPGINGSVQGTIGFSWF